MAITSAIFIVSLGITAAKFAIENAIAKSVNSKIYNEAIETSKKAAIERAESLKNLTGKKTHNDICRFRY